MRRQRSSGVARTFASTVGWRGVLALGVAVVLAGTAFGAATEHRLLQGGAAGRTSGLATRGTGLADRTASPRQTERPTLLGPIAPDEIIDFALALRVAEEGAIERYLDHLYDPTAAEYRHFLTAAEFGARFGLTLARIQGVQDWAVSQGFEVLGSYDQRTAIRLRAPAGKVEQVFDIRLARFLDHAAGIEFHAPLDAETVPAAVSDAVAGLSGLDNRPSRSAARELVGGLAGAVPAAGLGPIDLAKAYDIIPLYEAGLLGDGQTIAIVSFDTFTASDIATYDKKFGIDGPPVQRISVGKPLTVPGDGTVEVALDIEVVRAVAPHAQILNFEGKNGSIDHADLIDAIVEDGRADIVTDSWGKCDMADSFSVGSRQHGLRAMQAAAAAGISFFIASGDHGAFDCWSSDPSDHRESVDFPSAGPYSVAVGGTQLSVRADGTYLSEAGWEDYLSTGGSGGGNNPTEKRPVWQVGPGVDNEFSNGKRQSPDVAASAAVDSAYEIFATSPGEAGRWSHVYGTSAAAPFWAASMLLIRQLAEQRGVGPLGYVNPMLYALADSSQRDTIFHDVTRGGNLQQPAGPGWDYATGLGSPDVTALAGAIVTYLGGRP